MTDFVHEASQWERKDNLMVTLFNVLFSSEN
jgi:hypothetical protein